MGWVRRGGADASHESAALRGGQSPPRGVRTDAEVSKLSQAHHRSVSARSCKVLPVNPFKYETSSGLAGCQ
jgi:hypothetical protein